MADFDYISYNSEQFIIDCIIKWTFEVFASELISWILININKHLKTARLVDQIRSFWIARLYKLSISSQVQMF